MWSNNRKKDKNVTYLSSRYSNKIIELNRVSIFFHEVSRINVEFNVNHEFWSGILSETLKKFGGQILKHAGQIQNFSLNSTPKLKVEIQF